MYIQIIQMYLIRSIQSSVNQNLQFLTINSIIQILFIFYLANIISTKRMLVQEKTLKLKEIDSTSYLKF